VRRCATCSRCAARASQIDASIVSSTVPELGPEWSQMARRYLGHEMVVVGPGVKTGIPIRIDNPREVGADRLVNAVAAYARYGGACIVVDFGTAITYDVVSAEGEYLGGIISPGMEISLEALWERAAKLPEVELGEPRSLIGKTTADAVRSGIVYGFAAQVDGIVGRLRAELGGEAPAIATGGLAHHIVPPSPRRSARSTSCPDADGAYSSSGNATAEGAARARDRRRSRSNARATRQARRA
jgi:type III pantothenate kinase